jgi:TonB family protein
VIVILAKKSIAPVYNVEINTQSNSIKKVSAAIGLNQIIYRETKLAQKIETAKNSTPQPQLASINQSTTEEKTKIGENGNIKSVVFINFQKPQYPKSARALGQEGKIKIKVNYNSEGRITDVLVLESSGSKILDDSVKGAAMNWKLDSNQAGSIEKEFEFKLND